MSDDTIAAIATALGEGGLAVIRISGPTAFAVADRVFAATSSYVPSRAQSHTLRYGHIVRQGKIIDEVMLAVMRPPHTFTGEDTVEVSCHGGVLPAKLVLDTILENGARLAHPGEFTKRAFLNGRIDLVQAEAVADLIHARTELALRAANEQLAGKLSLRINALRDDLMRTLAHIEAHIDFPEEDIAPETEMQLLSRLEDAVASIDRLLATADEGQILRRGIRAAIIGRPNAGKSSLLNQLLGRERAIVSPLAGTTRDTIEETANVRGVPVVFVDTAGLRAAKDELELAGIQRSHQALASAELILHVIDLSAPVELAPEQILNELADRQTIVVGNKVDLLNRGDGPRLLNAVDVSCVTGQGIEALKDAIKAKVWSGDVQAEMLEVMINSRHQDALKRARDGVMETYQALQAHRSLELVAVDLRIAVSAVGEVVGKTTTEDLLDSIFSQFCLGK